MALVLDVLSTYLLVIHIGLQVYQVATDSYFYGKLVIAPFNIVFYNIFTNHGPNLYGTEHWSFYILNGILNFNIMFLLSMMAPLFVLLRKVCMLFCFNQFIWLKDISHKENKHLSKIIMNICFNMNNL